ncbi:MAG: YqaJ viral recombinase family protein, partial [Clostridium sp.]
MDEKIFFNKWIQEKRKDIEDSALLCKRSYGLNSDILMKKSDLSHEEWLRARKYGICGTDVSAIVGANKYKSLVEVYLDKQSYLVEKEENEKMYFGKILEEIVAKEFSRRNPRLKVKKVNAILRSRELPFAIGNIDRLITDENGEKGVLEIITASEYKKDSWKEDNIPYEAMLQLQWYLFITGTNYGYFAALIGGNKYVQKYVERDEELINMLMEVTNDFWENNVKLGAIPEVDGSEASTKLLNQTYPLSNGNEILLEENAVEFVEGRERIKVEIKKLEEDVLFFENKLKDMLGENEVGLVGDRRVMWKSYDR